MVYLTSNNLIGDFTRAMVDFTSKQEKVMISLVEGPINFTPCQQKRSIIKMISTFLYRYKIQLRKPGQTNSPILQLTVDEYNRHHKAFEKYKIKTTLDIKKSNRNQTLDFTTFCSADKSRFKLARVFVVPEFFVVCIKRATDTRNRITLTSSHYLPEREMPQEIAPLQELRKVTITTDGSYKSGGMGSAAIFEAEDMPPIIKLMKPEQYDASPLKAELQAYYSGLLLCHPGTEVTLRYDCEEIKNLVDLFNKPRLTQRIILKTPHYPLVNAINLRIEEIGSPITYIKIPRVLNEADLPSKTARMSQETAVHKVQHTEQHDFQIIYNGT